MSKKLWFLKQLDIFQGLPSTELKKIDKQLHNRKCYRKEVIFGPDSKNNVFILKKGKAEVYQINSEGKKAIIDILTPGSVFGNLGREEDGETYVEAITDGIVCSMDKNKFFEFISKYPSSSEKLLKSLFKRLVYQERRMGSLAIDNVLERFKKLILDLGESYGQEKNGKVLIKEKFTHEQLAQMLGVSRQTMTTIINQLRKKGIISRDNKKISFVPSKLKAAK